MFDFTQFCFIFGFMLIYPWEHRLYLYSLLQYIFCMLPWFKKNAFPHSSELRKHRTRLVSFRPSTFDLDIFDLVSRLASYYLVYTSVPRISATYICLESRRLSTSTTRLHRDIDLDIDLSYTHLTLILHSWKGYSPTRTYWSCCCGVCVGFRPYRHHRHIIVVDKSPVNQMEIQNFAICLQWMECLSYVLLQTTGHEHFEEWNGINVLWESHQNCGCCLLSLHSSSPSITIRMGCECDLAFRNGPMINFSSCSSGNV